MKKITMIAVLLAVVAAFTGCGQQSPVAPVISEKAPSYAVAMTYSQWLDSMGVTQAWLEAMGLNSFYYTMYQEYVASVGGTTGDSNNNNNAVCTTTSGGSGTVTTVGNSKESSVGKTTTTTVANDRNTTVGRN